MAPIYRKRPPDLVRHPIEDVAGDADLVSAPRASAREHPAETTALFLLASAGANETKSCGSHEQTTKRVPCQASATSAIGRGP